MNAVTCPILETAYGQAVPFLGMSINTTIKDLLTTTCMEQRYENNELKNIETVYTFPLPVDAVLLELSVQIGERLLKANVVEKSKAEQTYEDAITDGDTVVMLQQLESGMYSMNIGNLMPDEKITIKLVYAYTQQWQGSQLRVFIPTAIAPRYGLPSGLEPHQTPEPSMFVEHHCDFSVMIDGALAKARLSSPSHRISVQSEGEQAWVKLLDSTTFMNKDFILNIDSANDHSFGLYDRDREGYVALASFHPRFSQLETKQPRNFKIVVDCSGSMGGDSITQARVALKRILESLGDNDFFNIVLFGSSNRSLFKTMVPATSKYLEIALANVEQMDADMGGTEIGAALKTAYQLKEEVKLDNDILLITDGEIWDHEKVIKRAIRSGHRIFTVGVGNSVSEGFVRELAVQTGGAAELVSPNENMAERIVRHFKRMRAPAAKKVEMKWDAQPVRQLDIGPVYKGDTVNVYAWFAHEPGTHGSLVLHMHDGSVVTQDIHLRSAAKNTDVTISELSRLAAATQIQRMECRNEIVEIATRYQLMSLYTNYILVDVRAAEDKAGELPELRKVPQMLAEGWGGLGSGAVAASASITMDRLASPMTSQATSKLKRVSRSLWSSVEELDERFVNREKTDSPDLTELNLVLDEETFAIQFSLHYPFITMDELNLELLASSGLKPATLEILNKLVETFDEKHIVIAFLNELFNRYVDLIDRGARRNVMKLYKQSQIEESLIVELKRV